MTQVIDDEWRREKFTDLDIIVSNKTVQTKLNMDQGDEEMQQRIPITEVREWTDPGFSELIAPFTDPEFEKNNADNFEAGNNGPTVSNIR